MSSSDISSTRWLILTLNSLSRSAYLRWSSWYHQAVEEYKRELLEKAMAQSGGNQSRAAELLGMQRTYLSRLLTEMGLR